MVERDGQGRLIGRPVISTIWGGQRWVAVGDALSFWPLQTTVHEFLCSNLARTLGENWLAIQQQSLAADRHPVGGWLAEFETLRRGGEAIEKRAEGPNAISAAMTGNMLALVTLAYDVYTLGHHGVLDAALVDRLRRTDAFQGARYEVAVAAVFLRSGYSISWIEPSVDKTPEFLARDSAGKAVAVEAKSAHRSGVLGQPGAPPSPETTKVDVMRLFNRAMKKPHEGVPFAICIDLNLPESTWRSSPEGWFDQIKRGVLLGLGEPSPQKPDTFSVLFLTNFAWHWAPTDVADSAASFAIVPTYAANPLPPPQIETLREALAQYGNGPETWDNSGGPPIGGLG